MAASDATGAPGSPAFLHNGRRLPGSKKSPHIPRHPWAVESNRLGTLPALRLIRLFAMQSDPHLPPNRRDGSPGGPQPNPQTPFSHFPAHLQPPAPRSSKWKFRLLLLLILAGLIGPCTALFVPREVASWHLANAREAREAGNNDRAYAEMTSALRWRPDDPRLFLQRAAWRVEDGEAKRALSDVKEAEDRTRENYQVLMVKAQILQHLGRHAEAIRAWKAIDRLSLNQGVPDREMALNGLAYARAVGKLEIEQGLKEATEALNLAPGSAAVLDTHGYLLHLNGEHEKAIAEMDQAVRGMEEELTLIRSMPERWKQQQIAGSGGIDLTGLTDAETGVAVVRYHRALVLKALGREDDAQKDLVRVRELIGREPDDKLF
jgi:tetratricopeptide (TPR) repeat protein